VFEGARDASTDLFENKSGMPIKNMDCQGGYFMLASIKDCRDLVPKEFFDPTYNYENDSDTLIHQR
jgi:hypothetical protein